MFSFLPPLIEGELVYGFVARHAALLGLGNNKQLMARALGNGTVLTDAPAVGGLVRCIPALWNMDADNLIDAMTTLPYYEHGMWADSAARTRQLLAANLPRSPNEPGSRGRSNRRTPSTLRWCRLCAMTDQETAGMPTWHRMHQLPEALYCPTHAVPLLDSGLKLRAQTGLFLPSDRECGCQPVKCPYPEAMAERLSRSSRFLLEGVRPRDLRPRLPSLLSALMDGQPWYRRGSVSTARFRGALAGHFGAAVAERPELAILARNVQGTFNRARQPGGLPTTRLVLLLELCGETAETLLSMNPEPVARSTCAAHGQSGHAREMEVVGRAALPASAAGKGRGRFRGRPQALKAHPWRLTPELDAGLAPRVRQAGARLLESLPPRRITYSALEREVGEPTLLARFRALPLTTSAMHAFHEAPDAFHARRLRWLVDRLRSQECRMSTSDFLAHVGRAQSAETADEARRQHALLPNWWPSIRRLA